ncbi:hypothetical protein QJS10_CPA03g00059 [Acorus calamus]|uniref:Patatin n=1 Tax=Acorus calamus TaxID=4465 RepID=A0AAV9F715_ACOCL|nr:hypothetical protein QJS10_CPA03g00059 [Acorus calamus]
MLAFSTFRSHLRLRPRLPPLHLHQYQPPLFSARDAVLLPEPRDLATPTQFKPFRFASVDGRTTCTAVDGGLVMSNPAAVAVTHVLHYKRNFLTVHGVDDLFLLSLGTDRGEGGRRSCSGPSMVEIAFNQMIATRSSSPLYNSITLSLSLA